MKNKYLNIQIKKYSKLFSNTDERIAEFMIKNGNNLTDKTLSALAKEINVSETSIYNFVKKIGFKGFQDFKINLARNTHSPDSGNYLTGYSNISKNDSPMEVAQKITRSNIDSLSQFANDLDEDVLNQAVKIIDNSKSLNFFGQGGSSIVAKDSYHKFIRSQKHCNYNADYHIQLTYTTKLNEDDCAILFSHSGDTVETIQLARILKENNVKIITLTGNPGSELVELSDTSFIVYSEESLFRTETHTARILYLNIMDILVVTIMYKEDEENLSSIDNIREALEASKINKRK